MTNPSILTALSPANEKGDCGVSMVYLWLITLVAGTFLLEPYIHTYFIVGLVVYWLVRRAQPARWSQVMSLGGPFILFYLLHLLGALYSDDMGKTQYDLSTKASMLVFPLMAGVFASLSQQQVQRVLQVFVGTVLAGSIISLLRAWLLFDQTGDVKYFFYHDLANLANMHAIYLSMYVCFAILVIFQWLVSAWDRHSSIWLQILLVAAILFLLAYNLALSARMPTLALTAVVFAGILKVFYDRKSLFSGLLVIVLLLGTLLAGVYMSPVNKQRYKEVFNSSTATTSNKGDDGKTLRLQKWTCSWSIIKENWLFGLGIGDIQKNLDECYGRSGYTYLITQPGNEYNAHNQYLQTWLGLGIPGLASLLLLFGSLIGHAIRRKHYLLFGFTIMFMLVSLTESTLPAHKGVVFFSFFAMLLLFGDIPWPWKGQQPEVQEQQA